MECMLATVSDGRRKYEECAHEVHLIIMDMQDVKTAVRCAVTSTMLLFRAFSRRWPYSTHVT